MTGREERKNKIENKINQTLKGKSPLYANYVAACFSEGQQPTTVKSYLQYAISFMDYLGNECTTESVKKILPLDVTGYLNNIRTKFDENGQVVPTSTSYRATAYSALKSFFEFLRINKVIDENPVSMLKRPKVTDEKPDTHLSIREMKKLIKTVQRGTNKQEGKSKTHEAKLKSRDLAIIRTLLELGIRCSALISLDVDNVDLENKRINYIDKGEKAFEKPISDELAKCLASWMKDRAKINGLNTNALFVSEKKRRCSHGTITNIVKTFTREAVGVEMTAHKMRHSAITAIYELNGHDIVHASKFAGHSNVSITQRYINTDYTKKDLEVSQKLGALI